MSTLATANLADSSDEEDQDFVPVSPKPKTKTTTKGSSTVDQDDEEAKRTREEQEKAQAIERKRKAAEAFAAMKEETFSSSSAREGTSGATSGASVEMVQVKRRRRYAGETIEETVTLRADHPEAIAYLKKSAGPSDTADGSPKPVEVPNTNNGEPSTVASDPPASDTVPSISGASAGMPAPLPRPPTVKRAPPRRRPRQSLEQMSAALDKGKKMTTLEKSQMDWKNHTSDAKLRDELDTHRRGGGYLEKQEFLDRVGERKELQQGAGSTKRRP